MSGLRRRGSAWAQAGTVPEHAMPHLSSAKHRPIPGCTWKPWITEMEWHELHRSRNRNEHSSSSPLCTDSPTTTNSRSKWCVFRGVGTLFSKYEQTNEVNMVGENPSELIEGLSLGSAKICIWILCKVIPLPRASGFKYLRTASKRSPFSVPSVLGHGAFLLH